MKRFDLIIPVSLIIMSCNSAEDTNYEMDVPEDLSVRIINDPNFGEILTDSKGRTLYMFSLDQKGDPSCVSEECLEIWPPFYVEDLEIDPNLNPAYFGTAERNDGQLQTTFKGWPLYYYSGDEIIGDVKGDGILDVWFVAKPNYSLMYVKNQLLAMGANGELVAFNSDYEEGDGLTSYITDGFGNTIYLFSKDLLNTNTFTKEDFSNNSIWPIFYTNISQLPTILDMEDFSEIIVHGEKQLTFKGWPLYYYGEDVQRGDNFGIGVPTPGIWPVVNNETIQAVDHF